MFKFLKEKLKNVVNKFSKKIDEEGVEEEVEEEIEKKEEKEPEIKEKEIEKEEIIETKKEKIEEEEKREIKEKGKRPEEPKVKEEVEIKRKIQQGKTPSIHELAKRKKKKEQISKPKEEIEIIKEPEFIKQAEEILEKEEEKESEKKPSAHDILKEVKEEDKPKKEDKDLTADELIKEAEKIKTPEDKILTAKEIRAKFEKEREAKEKEIEQDIKEEIQKTISEQEKTEPEPEAKGFFAKLKQKIVTKRINEKQFDEIFWDLEVALMENNVAIEVIEKIKQDLKTNLVDKPIKRGKISDVIINSLKNSVIELFDVDKLSIINKIAFYKEQENKPFVICFLGINGSGKTTSIAKFVKLLQENNMSSVIAAADTFRAAAIQQLEEHGSRLGVKVIKHDYGADAAAVSFDAIKYAEAHNVDVVLIDTAGRMHSNVNLMDELKKIIRVSSPNLNVFVGESITGNDCVDQAKRFDESVGVDAIILTKADVDEKGGAALSVSYVTKKPIIYLGVGQEYTDLEEFDKDKIIKNLGFE